MQTYKAEARHWDKLAKVGKVSTVRKGDDVVEVQFGLSEEGRKLLAWQLTGSGSLGGKTQTEVILFSEGGEGGKSCVFFRAMKDGRCICISDGGDVVLYRYDGSRSLKLEAEYPLGGCSQVEFQTAYVPTFVVESKEFVDPKENEGEEEDGEDVAVDHGVGDDDEEGGGRDGNGVHQPFDRPHPCLSIVKENERFFMLALSVSPNEISLLSKHRLDAPEDADGVLSVTVSKPEIVVLWGTGDMDIIRDEKRMYRRKLVRKEVQNGTGEETNAARATTKMEKEKKPFGQLVAVQNGYFAVLFDAMVSVWDSRFGVGHCYQEQYVLSSYFASSAALYYVSKVLFLTRHEEVFTLSYSVPEVLSLATALSVGRGRCSEIIVDSSYEEAPYGAMPSITTALTAAADASTVERFGTTLENAEKNDLSAFRKVVSPDLTPTAESLTSVLQLPKTSHARKETRATPDPITTTTTALAIDGTVDDDNVPMATSENEGVGAVTEDDVATSTVTAAADNANKNNRSVKKDSKRRRDKRREKIPVLSERLASATASRCVIEVGRGNLEFHDPLIRVLETGYVSSYALATSYEALRWDLGEKGLSNVVDALQTEKLIPALEAYLKNVVDVAERDTVRSAMFAVSLNAKESKSVVASSLLLAAISARFEPHKLTAALRLLPIRNVIALLEFLNEKIFESFFDEPILRVPETAAVISDGYFKPGTYRKATMLPESEHCIAWMSHILEAHFASLILESKINKLIARIIGRVREGRQFCETMEPINGMVQQILERKSLPVAPRPEFIVETLSLP